MSLANLFDGLQFNNNFILYDKVSPECRVEYHLFIPDGDRHLPTDTKTTLLQFIRQDDFINRFEQSRTKLFVHRKGGVQDDPADFILRHNLAPLRFCLDNRPIRSAA